MCIYIYIYTHIASIPNIVPNVHFMIAVPNINCKGTIVVGKYNVS